MKPLLVAIMGPTASGKTDLAEAVADEIGAQLVNADTFQCYRHLDIGTAKPDRRQDYRLIDIVEPEDGLGVGAWIQHADAALDRVRNVVIVGGSGLNIRALVEGYGEMRGAPDPGLREELNSLDLSALHERLARATPEAATSVDMQNPVRVRRAIERAESSATPIPPPDLETYRIVKIGLELPTEIGDLRISQRTKAMLDAGWLEEVEGLRRRGVSYDAPGLKAHGYRTLWDVLEDRKSLEAAELEISTMVRQYSKRQRTWLRREPNLSKISMVDRPRAIKEALSLLD